jgi:hypothetical protein
MKKQITGLFVFSGLALMLAGSPVPAQAVNIANLNGQACGEGFVGAWHFINNQTGGAAPGTLNATWDSGDTCTTGPSKLLNSVQHFDCIASGKLLSASTNLPGRLVLSDFTCVKEECVPDPKGEICGDGIDNDCDGQVDEGCEPPK